MRRLSRVPHHGRDVVRIRAAPSGSPPPPLPHPRGQGPPAPGWASPRRVEAMALQSSGCLEARASKTGGCRAARSLMGAQDSAFRRQRARWGGIKLKITDRGPCTPSSTAGKNTTALWVLLTHSLCRGAYTAAASVERKVSRKEPPSSQRCWFTPSVIRHQAHFWLLWC